MYLIFTEHGASTYCDDEVYGGPKVFSELETSSLSNYIKSISSELVGYISFHSYGELLMVPYGYTTDHLDNYNDTVRLFYNFFRWFSFFLYGSRN